jgi:protein ImuA
MLDQLRQRLQALQKPAALEGARGCLPLGVAPIDAALGGGLARGALHEIAAPGEAHLAAATGFVMGLLSLSSSWPGLSRPSRLERHCVPDRDARHKACARSGRRPDPSAGHDGNNIAWIAEDMTLMESGALCGLGLEAIGLLPERLLTVAAARAHDLLWAMEEALRCRSVGAVIGEWRHGAIDPVAVRRLSLAAADSGTLAMLLRAAPANDASTAATRWIVGAAPSLPSPGGGGEENLPRFTAHLIRNRRGPTGSWILQWSETDERFLLVPHAQPVAAPALDRSDRKVA